MARHEQVARRHRAAEARLDEPKLECDWNATFGGMPKRCTSHGGPGDVGQPSGGVFVDVGVGDEQCSVVGSQRSAPRIVLASGEWPRDVVDAPRCVS